MSQEINSSSPSKRAFKTFFRPSSSDSLDSPNNDRPAAAKIKVYKGSPVWGSSRSDRSASTTPPPPSHRLCKAPSPPSFFQKSSSPTKPSGGHSSQLSRPSSAPPQLPQPSVPEPLWPDKDWFQGGHVGVPARPHGADDSSSSSSNNSVLSTPTTNRAVDIMESNEFFAQCAEARASRKRKHHSAEPRRSRYLSFEQVAAFMHTVYPGGMQSPACQSLLASIAAPSKRARDSGSSTTMLWTEKYRPCCVQELLGNRDDHTYLRDWLHQMKVMSPAALEQLRKSRKAPGKDLFDNIPTGDEGDDDFVPGSSRYRHHAKSASTKPAPDQRMQSNLLLMVGGHGVGKTAAVYTAAEEAGYEVFEIHPGMRRSGKDLTASVGEMTESHLVAFDGSGKRSNGTTPAAATHESRKRKRGPPPQPPPKPKVDFFAQFKQEPKRNSPPPSAVTTPPPQQPQQHTAFSATHDPPTQRDADSTPQEPKQSLVLLEEADILYEDDKGFWPAVTDLAQKSKRPIILTCNDLNVVPLEQLFLQAVLVLKPPKKDELLAYLQLICFAEGFLVQPADLAGLFASIGDDIRQLIMTLQLWCCDATVSSVSDKEAHKEDRPDTEAKEQRQGTEEQSAAAADPVATTTSSIYHECPRLFQRYSAIDGDFSRPECLAQLYCLEQPRSKTGLDLVEFYEHYIHAGQVDIESTADEQDDSLSTILQALDAVACLDRKEGQEHECDEYGPSSADRPTGDKPLWKAANNTDHLFWDYGDSMATRAWVANYEQLKNKDWLTATLWEQLLDARSETAGECISASDAVLPLRAAALSEHLVMMEYLPHIRSMCAYDQGVASRGRALRTRRKRRYLDALSEGQRHVLLHPPRFHDITKTWCESLEPVFTRLQQPAWI